MASLANSRRHPARDPAKPARLAWKFDLTVLAVLLLGFLSTLLFLYSDLLWRTSFRKNVPLLDNIMQARVSLAEAYLWLDELLKGNEAIHMAVILRSYDQAAQAVDACLQGESVIKGLPGLPAKEGDFRAQLERFKETIQRTRTIAEARWQSREDSQTARSRDRDLHTAYHGLGLMAGTITSKVQEEISQAMTRQRMVHILTLSLWLTIIAGVAVLLISASKRRQQAKVRLDIYQERLRSLASELVLTEERERRGLATDLHDAIAQNLAMSKTKLDSLRSQLPSEELVTAIDEVREILNPTIRDARSLIFQLSPPILYLMGLEAAVESLIEQTQEQHGLVITLEDDHEPKPLSEDILVLLFRAVRELLINVIKHARAKSARITIRRDNGRVRIDLEDDGIGFDPGSNYTEEPEKAGFGLFSIKERIHHLGGDIEIHSQPGQGTRVSLVAPLQGGG